MMPNNRRRQGPFTPPLPIVPNLGLPKLPHVGVQNPQPQQAVQVQTPPMPPLQTLQLPQVRAPAFPALSPPPLQNMPYGAASILDTLIRQATKPPTPTAAETALAKVQEDTALRDAYKKQGLAIPTALQTPEEQQAEADKKSQSTAEEAIIRGQGAYDGLSGRDASPDPKWASDPKKSSWYAEGYQTGKNQHLTKTQADESAATKEKQTKADTAAASEKTKTEAAHDKAITDQAIIDGYQGKPLTRDPAWSDAQWYSAQSGYAQGQKTKVEQKVPQTADEKAAAELVKAQAGDPVALANVQNSPQKYGFTMSNDGVQNYVTSLFPNAGLTAEDANAIYDQVAAGHQRLNGATGQYEMVGTTTFWPSIKAAVQQQIQNRRQHPPNMQAFDQGGTGGVPYTPDTTQPPDTTTPDTQDQAPFAGAVASAGGQPPSGPNQPPNNGGPPPPGTPSGPTDPAIVTAAQESAQKNSVTLPSAFSGLSDLAKSAADKVMPIVDQVTNEAGWLPLLPYTGIAKGMTAMGIHGVEPIGNLTDQPSPMNRLSSAVMPYAHRSMAQIMIRSNQQNAEALGQASPLSPQEQAAANADLIGLTSTNPDANKFLDEWWNAYEKNNPVMAFAADNALQAAVFHAVGLGVGMRGEGIAAAARGDVPALDTGANRLLREQTPTSPGAPDTTPPPDAVPPETPSADAAGVPPPAASAAETPPAPNAAPSNGWSNPTTGAPISDSAVTAIKAASNDVKVAAKAVQQQPNDVNLFNALGKTQVALENALTDANIDPEIAKAISKDGNILPLRQGRTVAPGAAPTEPIAPPPEAPIAPETTPITPEAAAREPVKPGEGTAFPTPPMGTGGMDDIEAIKAADVANQAAAPEAPVAETPTEPPVAQPEVAPTKPATTANPVAAEPTVNPPTTQPTEEPQARISRIVSHWNKATPEDLAWVREQYLAIPGKAKMASRNGTTPSHALMAKVVQNSIETKAALGNQANARSVLPNTPKSGQQAASDILAANTPKAEPSRPLAASGARSVDQMLAAAEAPPARTIEGPIGKTTTAQGVLDPNTEYQFRYRAVPLDDVIPSHTDTLAENPNYPIKEMQGRNRGSAVSELQRNSIAAAPRVEELTTDTGRLDSGTPIINSDGAVISGNGRVLGYRQMRTTNADNFSALQEAQRAKLATYGLTEADLAGIKDPIIVREVTTPLDQKGLVRLADEANKNRVLGMSSAEKAQVDARTMNPAILDELKVAPSSTLADALNSPGNKDAVRHFLAQFTPEERAPLVAADGQSLNADGIKAFQNAIFARTYTGEAGKALSNSFIEGAEGVRKNVQTGLFQSLPEMAKAEELIKSGERPAELSLASDVAKSVEKLNSISRQGMSVSNYLSQIPMGEHELTALQRDILDFFGKDGAKSPKAIRAFLDDYAKAVQDLPNPNQGSFMDIATPTKESLAKGIIDNYQRTGVGRAEAGMFDTPSGMIDLGGERGSGPNPLTFAVDITRAAYNSPPMRYTRAHPVKVTAGVLAGLYAVGVAQNYSEQARLGQQYYSTDPKINALMTIVRADSNLPRGLGWWQDHVMEPGAETAFEVVDAGAAGIAQLLGAKPDLDPKHRGFLNINQPAALLGHSFTGPDDYFNFIHEQYQKRMDAAPFLTFLASLPFDPLNYIGWGEGEIAIKSAPGILGIGKRTGIEEYLANAAKPLAAIPDKMSLVQTAARADAPMPALRTWWNAMTGVTAEAQARSLSQQYGITALQQIGHGPTNTAVETWLRQLEYKLQHAKASIDETQLAHAISPVAPLDERAVKELQARFGALGTDKPDITPAMVTNVEQTIKTMPDKTAFTPDRLDLIGKALGKDGPLSKMQVDQVNAWLVAHALPDLSDAISRATHMLPAQMQNLIERNVRKLILDNAPTSPLRQLMNEVPFVTALADSKGYQMFTEQFTLPAIAMELTSLGFLRHGSQENVLRAFRPGQMIAPVRYLAHVLNEITKGTPDLASRIRAVSMFPNRAAFTAAYGDVYTGDTMLSQGIGSFVHADKGMMAPSIVPFVGTGTSRVIAQEITKRGVSGRALSDPIAQGSKIVASVAKNANLSQAQVGLGNLVKKQAAFSRIAFIHDNHPEVYKQVVGFMNKQIAGLKEANAQFESYLVRPENVTPEAWAQVEPQIRMAIHKGDISSIIDGLSRGEIDQHALAMGAWIENGLPEMAKPQIWHDLALGTPEEATAALTRGAASTPEELFKAFENGGAAYQKTLAALHYQYGNGTNDIVRSAFNSFLDRAKGLDAATSDGRNKLAELAREGMKDIDRQMAQNSTAGGIILHRDLWDYAMEVANGLEDPQAKAALFANVRAERQALMESQKAEQVRAASLFHDKFLEAKGYAPFPKAILADIKNMHDELISTFKKSDENMNAYWANVAKTGKHNSELLGKLRAENDQAWRSYNQYRLAAQDRMYGSIDQYMKGLAQTKGVKPGQPVLMPTLGPDTPIGIAPLPRTDIPLEALQAADDALASLKDQVDTWVKRPTMDAKTVEALKAFGKEVDAKVAAIPPEIKDKITLAHKATARIVTDMANTHFVNHANETYVTRFAKTFVPFFSYDVQGGAYYLWLAQHVPGAETSTYNYLNDSGGQGYMMTPIPGVRVNPLAGMWPNRLVSYAKKIAGLQPQSVQDGLKDAVKAFLTPSGSVVDQGLISAHFSPAIELGADAARWALPPGQALNALGGRETPTQWQQPPPINTAEDVLALGAGAVGAGNEMGLARTDRYTENQIAQELKANLIDPLDATNAQKKDAERTIALRDMISQEMPVFTYTPPTILESRKDFQDYLATHFQISKADQVAAQNRGQSVWSMMNAQQKQQLMKDHPEFNYTLEASDLNRTPEQIALASETHDYIKKSEAVDQTRINDVTAIDNALNTQKINPQKWMSAHSRIDNIAYGAHAQNGVDHPKVIESFGDPKKEAALLPNDQAVSKYYQTYADAIKSNTDPATTEINWAEADKQIQSYIQGLSPEQQKYVNDRISRNQTKTEKDFHQALSQLEQYNQIPRWAGIPPDVVQQRADLEANYARAKAKGAEAAKAYWLSAPPLLRRRLPANPERKKFALAPQNEQLRRFFVPPTNADILHGKAPPADQPLSDDNGLEIPWQVAPAIGSLAPQPPPPTPQGPPGSVPPGSVPPGAPPPPQGGLPQRPPIAPQQ